MKHILITSLVLTTFCSSQAQFKINTKVVDATKNVAKAVTFSDADAAAYAKEAIAWMDANNPVAEPMTPTQKD